MAIRAVIIAVENYPNAAQLAPRLEGTLAQGREFQDWLIAQKKLRPENIRFFPDPTKAQVSLAFRDLVDAGRENTEELYVYYSGHGFSYADNPWRQKPADVLVGSDFQNLRDSGDACLKLEDVQFMLWQCMGPGDHYYFIDACRNMIKASQVNPASLGWTRDPSSMGQPKVFTIFSTERGSVAAVASGFGDGLVKGLSGKGRAKRREGTRMYVTFDSLCRYLEETLKQKIEPVPGGGPGRILEIAPIPTYRCEIEVDNAKPDDVFTLVVQNALQQPVRLPETFQGNRTSIVEKPDDYFLQVTHPVAAVQPVRPAEADLYEDCTVRFRKTAAPPLPPSPPLSATVSVAAAADSTVLIRNLRTNDVIESPAGFAGALAPGDYSVKMKDPGRRTVREHRMSLRAGESVALDIGRREPTPVGESLVRAIPGAHDEQCVDFSESLGPMANTDLGLWLSICGAARIVREWGDFSKLRYLPLETFEDVRPGDSPIYVLLGLETLPPSVEVGVSKSRVEWERLEAVPGLTGVYEYRANASPGPQLVSLRLEGKASLTTASYCLPNRATLFTVAQDAAGVLSIHQYILPLAKLEGELSPQERQWQPSNALGAIRFIALAQNQLARRRPIRPPAEGAIAPEDLNNWIELVTGKWMDPIMAIMASYELVRTGEFPMGPGQTGEVVLRNLRTYFGGIPDVEAIARLANVDHRKRPGREEIVRLAYSYSEARDRQGGSPDEDWFRAKEELWRQHGVPLFLAGLIAFPDYEELLPLPANRLDFSSPWTCWIGAVN